MADEKPVVAAPAALRRAAGPTPVEVVTQPVIEPAKTESPVEAQKQVPQQSAENIAQSLPPKAKKWKFIKNYGVAQELKFKDGSSFTFRLIERNDGSGYMTNSFVVTEDETLAKNLRELGKNPHSAVVEVSA